MTIDKLTVVDVFNFWVEMLRSGDGRRGPKPVLSPKRERKIRQALTWYGVEACRQAIQGCSMSEFHMGKNPSGRRYDDIELILRDPEHVERFIDIFHEKKTGGGFLDEE